MTKKIVGEICGSVIYQNSWGLFAPSISYHKGLFYIVCTLVDKLGNFVITASNPKGPWSNPVALPQIDGIDPSLFFDDNDSAYLVYNSIPPDNITLHNGHRTIRINTFDCKNLKIISDNKIIVNGGTDMAKKPVSLTRKRPRRSTRRAPKAGGSLRLGRRRCGFSKVRRTRKAAFIHGRDRQIFSSRPATGSAR